MAETLFSFDRRNYRDCQKAFRGVGNQEYYLGDYSIEGGGVIDVHAERRLVGACSIIHMQSTSRQFFRRSWSHIREDGTDVVVLWLIKRGRLCVSHQTGYNVAKSGDFIVTNSATPFFIECQTDDASVHEVLHVVIPTHLCRRFVTDELKTGYCIPSNRHEFVVAEHIFQDLLDRRAIGHLYWP